MIGALRLILRRLRPLLLAALVLFLAPSLSAQASLEGTVLDNGVEYLGNGATAVVHARVELIDVTDSTRRFSDYTDSEGRYFIPISTTGVQEPAIVPAAMALHQNYPNPFNPSTIISFELPGPGPVLLQIYNVLGQRVTTLLDGFRPAGSGLAIWDGTDAQGRAVAAGIYIYLLATGETRIHRKMLLLDGGGAALAAAAGLRAHADAPDQVSGSSAALAILTGEPESGKNMNKISGGLYRLRITGPNIYSREQENISITGQTHLDLAVARSVTDSEGHIYPVVKIGDFWWMAENLRVTRYRNGDLLPNLAADTDWLKAVTGAWCDIGNQDNTAALYGHLYNGWAVLDSRNIAPTGWHVAGGGDWAILETALGMSPGEVGEMGWRGTGIAAKVKLFGAHPGWEAWNQGAANTSGLAILPAGYRVVEGGRAPFRDTGAGAALWTSSPFDSRSSWSRSFAALSSQIRNDIDPNTMGYAVRCISDYSPPRNYYAMSAAYVDEVLGHATVIEDPEADWVVTGQEGDNPGIYPAAYVDIDRLELGVDDTWLFVRLTMHGAFPADAAELPVFAGDSLTGFNLNLALDTDNNSRTGCLADNGAELLLGYGLQIFNGSLQAGTGYAADPTGIDSPESARYRKHIYPLEVNFGGMGTRYYTMAIPLVHIRLVRDQAITINAWTEAPSAKYHHGCFDRLCPTSLAGGSEGCAIQVILGQEITIH
ncbi:MAG TPA: FISUMP domain-containing protein [bacterium]|nr:FISUMP domain-containing protein [bacterium]HPR87985.1 FISUMP domain-containing protein [bacterium]